MHLDLNCIIFDKMRLGELRTTSLPNPKYKRRGGHDVRTYQTRREVPGRTTYQTPREVPGRTYQTLDLGPILIVEVEGKTSCGNDNQRHCLVHCETEGFHHIELLRQLAVGKRQVEGME
jgi:hypothetical protein